MMNNKYFLTVRRLIIALAISSPFLIQAQVTLSPDHSWKDESKANWYPKGYGTSFYLYNGLLYAFNYTDNGVYNGAYPYIYLVNKNHTYSPLEPYGLGPFQVNRIDNFGYPGEPGGPYDYYRPPLLGPNFLFQYQGRMWYYQVIKNKHQDPVTYKIADSYYECWAKMPTSQAEKCFAYNDAYIGSPTIIRHCGFQVDSLLCFITRDNTANNWMIMEYLPVWSNDEHEEVVRFYNEANIWLPPALNGYTLMGGYIPRKDSLDHQYFILNFYNENGDVRLWKLTPDTSGFPRIFTSADLGGITFSKPVSATAIAPGTIKASRDASQVADKNYSDRMVLFGLNKNKSTYGYNMQYKEYIFENGSLVPGISGDLSVSNNEVPSKAGDYFQIKAGVELMDMDYTETMAGNDGYQSFIWVFYPDDNKNFRGQQFFSDQWRLDPKEIPYSEDLSHDELYDGIIDMWTLVGVIEGAPPVSVNWPVWDANHPLHTAVSTMVLKNEYSNTVRVVNYNKDQCTVGESMAFTISGGKKSENITSTGQITPRKKGWSLTFSETIKFTKAKLSLSSSAQENFVTLDYPYSLYESAQDFGTFIYTVPQIKRYRYNTYPWWETDALQYPIPNSTQYLFRTYGLSTVNKSVPLSGNPYFVANPNGTSMHDWMDTVRFGLQDYIIGYDKRPDVILNWDNNHNGTIGHIETTYDSLTSNAVSKDFKFQGSVTYENKNPSIFKISKASGFGILQGTYTSESSVRTEFGNAVTLSLNNLFSQSDGVNISHLHENVYLFTWERDSTLWVYDSLGDSHPWYIAYLATDVSKMIDLLAPENGSTLGESDLQFAWEVVNGELQDCRIVISNSPQIDKGSIIYQEKTDTRSVASISKTLFTHGSTYYWAVTGNDGYRQPVWSPVRSFTLKQDDTGSAVSDVNVFVYPNPGKSNEIRVLIDQDKNETVEITLFDLSGRFVAADQYQAKGLTQPVTFKLPSENLQPGLYLLRIKTPDEQIIRKVVIK